MPVCKKRKACIAPCRRPACSHDGHSYMKAPRNGFMRAVSCTMQPVQSAAMPMLRSLCRPLLALATILLFGAGLMYVPSVSAQHAAPGSNRPVPGDHWAYEYIHRLQARGYLTSLHPTALPYTGGEIASALKSLRIEELPQPVRRWAERLHEEYGSSQDERGAQVGITVQPGVRASSTQRLDPLRPAPDSDVPLQVAGLHVYPQTAIRVFLEHGPLVAQGGMRFDAWYRYDPDALEAANRLVSRNEEAYIGFGTRYVSVYAGRLAQHWGPYGETALLISQNPVDFDRMYVRIGGDRLALRSIVGELDSMTGDGRFTGTAGADSVRSGSIRRYLSAHRLDWRPSRNVAISLMESTVWSGSSAGLSLKFFNPLTLHALAVDGRPKNDENNGLLAGMAWAQYRTWTFQGQVLLDDADLLNQSGEPSSIALSGSLKYAGLARADLGTAWTAVAARTYNAHQPEGRYTHLLRGIGAPYNDYIHAAAYATFYAGRGELDLAVSPRLDILFQGTADIHDPYPFAADAVEFILDGVAERVVRPGLRLRAQHGASWWGQIDVGPAFIRNEAHRTGNDRTIFTVTLSAMARFGGAKRISLSL